MTAKGRCGSPGFDIGAPDELEGIISICPPEAFEGEGSPLRRIADPRRSRGPSSRNRKVARTKLARNLCSDHDFYYACYPLACLSLASNDEYDQLNPGNQFVWQHDGNTYVKT